MRFARPRARASDEYSLLPLTNIVFLLMIFFLLIGRIAPPNAFSIQPPESSSQASLAAKALTIEIAADGKIAVGGEPVSLDELAATVRSRRLESAAGPVRLRADGRMAATRVVRIMQILQRAGIERLRLVTRGS